MDQTLGLIAAAAVVVRENGFDVHPFHPVSEGARWDIVLDRGPESIGKAIFLEILPSRSCPKSLFSRPVQIHKVKSAKLHRSFGQK